jgi:hypothetical protein
MVRAAISDAAGSNQDEDACTSGPTLAWKIERCKIWKQRTTLDAGKWAFLQVGRTVLRSTSMSVWLEIAPL